MSAPVGFWARLIGAALANRLVVLLVTGLLLVLGLILSPLAGDYGPLPRAPLPVDAIPDLGENQQIVFTDWPGRAPRDVEDQITYPLTASLLGLPGVKTVRSTSMLGFSSIYVIFEQGVDFYDSRTRILERLSALAPDALPGGVSPTLGPDATGLGQVYWYTLEARDPQGKPLEGWELHELRALQDWTVRYALQAVSGVSEVASVGGHVQEYQIDVDPQSLALYGLTIAQVASAVRASNLDVGARTMEVNRVEYVVRGVGLVKDVAALEEAVVAWREDRPLRVRDVAQVGLGPAQRRGALDVGGAQAVGGVVVARYGENPMRVLDGVRAQVEAINRTLPTRTLEDGRVAKVQIIPFYDRSALISETLGTLSQALKQQLVITVIVVLVLLGFVRSALVISAALPLAVLLSFALMRLVGVDANVMSLAGIAIAIGTMVDMGIVLVENMVERLEDAPPGADRLTLIRDSAAEVAPAVMTSTLTTVLSFLPVFALTDAEGKLFQPLAFTKTFALVASLALAVLVLPTLTSLIMWPRVSRVTARGPWWRDALRAVTRPTHARDWLLFGAGVALIAWGMWPIGAFACLLALTRLARGLVPERWRRVTFWVENIVAIAVMTWVLTDDWMPLGFGLSFSKNLTAVVVVVGGLLFVFWAFIQVYPRLLRWMLANKGTFLIAPTLLLFVGATVWLGADQTLAIFPQALRASGPLAAIDRAMPGLGREFMPAFDEGAYLYMPTTMPHASMSQALDQLQAIDAAIQQIPEVQDAVGKLGRAESALDPAPISMFETVVTYKPEWRVEADGSRARQWRAHIRSPQDIWREVVEAAEQPGLTSAPMLMPINTRIVMLQSGMRAPLGVKVQGPTLEAIEAAGLALEAQLKQSAGVKAAAVFAERIVGKPYLEVRWDREALARYGVTMASAQETLQLAIGGPTLTRTVEGRARYPVRVRAMRELRDSPQALEALLIATPSGATVPLSQLGQLVYTRGPQMIKAEDSFLTSYVIFDREPGLSEAELVERLTVQLREAQASGALSLPQGVTYSFAGTYLSQVRSEARLRLLVPLALALVLLVLHLQFRAISTTLMIFTGVAVAISGGFLLLWLYGQPWFLNGSVWGVELRALFQVAPVNMSVAVWVGFIALAGIATDDGVVMATYLQDKLSESPPQTRAEVRALVLEAGLRRVRPCLMTTATTILALLPVITSRGRGSDVMLPMALPAMGGMAIELLTLFVVPVLYAAREEGRLRLRVWRARVSERWE